jgi:peroxiredoxin
VGPAVPAETRRPRLIFLVVGLIVAAGLGVGLFTGVGTDTGSTDGGRPVVGSTAPPFTLPRLGGGTVSDPPVGAAGRPVVLLFFGNWCPQCHGELPVLAAAVRTQHNVDGPLAGIVVEGVDSFDTAAAARSFTRSAGVTFPVGLDRDADVTNGLYYFPGDPVAVFIDGAHRITAIRFGPLSASEFEQQERSILTPSGT